MRWIASLAFSAAVWAVGTIIALVLLEQVWAGWMFVAGSLFTTAIYDPLNAYADRNWFHVEQNDSKEETPDAL